MKFNQICNNVAVQYFKIGDFVSARQFMTGHFLGNDCVIKIIKKQNYYYLGFSDGSVSIVNECKKNS